MQNIYTVSNTHL